MDGGTGGAGLAYDDALFVLGGDPCAIAVSASEWRAFAKEAAGAADALRRLDTGDFAGDEADGFRQVLGADLPHRLRTSGQAWGIVGTALTRFGGRLDDCQQRMRPLRVRAADTWQAMCRARNDVAAQRFAQHPGPAGDQPPAGHPGGGSAALPLAGPRPCTADERLDGATAHFRALVDSARAIRAEHDHARDECAAQIRRAAQMRFAEPPGWFAGLLSSVGTWISDHAPLLRGISAVLKQISSISGMLAMIPVLAPVMAPISAATGAGAVAVDGAVMAATGQGSWRDLVLDGASMLPGAKAAVAVGTVQTAVAVNDAADGDGSWADVLTAAASVAIGAKGAHGKPSREPGPATDQAPARQTEPASAHRDPAQGSDAKAPDGPPARSVDDAAATPNEVDEYGDGVPQSFATSQPSTASGGSDHGPTADPAPSGIPSIAHDLFRAGASKVPASWPPPIPNRKGTGLRWFAPNPKVGGLRIDRGDPHGPLASQRVDHVIVRSNGKVLGPDGLPIIGPIAIQYQAHIPLSEWVTWQEWNKP